MTGQGNYDVDIVLCIDSTGSMGHIIEEVKTNALALHEMIDEAMTMAGKEIGNLRVKVIAFGDYQTDAQPMRESPFYEISDQSDELSAFVQGITANGGGDIPENGFEAIATAMKSDWVAAQDGRTRRQVIAIFTDAPALALGERAGCPGYPTDLPKTMAELSAWWEGTDQTMGGTYAPTAGRLVAYVPNDESWTPLETWNRYTPRYTGGKGCSGVDMEDIVMTIVSSFSA